MWGARGDSEHNLRDRPLSEWGSCPNPEGRQEHKREGAGGMHGKGAVLYDDSCSLCEV